LYGVHPAPSLGPKLRLLKGGCKSSDIPIRVSVIYCSQGALNRKWLEIKYCKPASSVKTKRRKTGVKQGLGVLN